MNELDREWELFDGALAAAPEEREAWLRARCDDDPSMLERIQALLRADSKGAARPVSKHGVRPGATVGGYRIVRLISEGGMGAVFEAEQDRPRRTVAIKVLRGSLGRRAITRFEREAEALGRLRHVGIARIYEVGTLESDVLLQPFLVMERIDGLSLTDFAARHQLDIEERVRLLIRLCDALEHAHAAGIVHRDLKPANILVEESGQPKILDFGLARMDEDATDSLATGQGEVFGTLPYMSPEQVSGEPESVDKRTDLYAVGAMAYELFAGKRPLDVDELPLVEAARSIREVDPIRLGTIDRRLRGDIETIVSAAMEKDKARRYSSAAAVAEDFGRFLEHRPIVARPPSTFYQVQKFAGRHRALVTGGFAVILSLGVGLVFALVALNNAETERSRFEKINQVFREMLASANPAKNDDVTLREFLDRTSEDVRVSLEDAAEIRGPIEETLAIAYMGLGEFEKASAHLDSAWEATAANQDESDPDLWSIKVARAELDFREGRPDDAAEVAREVLAAIAHDVDLWRIRCRAWSVLGYSHLERSRLGDSRREFEKALTEYRRRGAPEARHVELSLVEVDRQAGDYVAAHDRLVGILKEYEARYGEGSQAASVTRSELSVSLGNLGRFDEAVAVAERCVRDMERIYGRRSSRYANALLDLGNAEFARGAREESLRALEASVAAYESAVEPEHPHLALARAQLGLNYVRFGRAEEGLPLLQTALHSFESVDPGSARHAMTEGSLGRAKRALGLVEEAEQHMRNALAMQQRLFGEKHHELAPMLSELGQLALADGRVDEAEDLLRRSFEVGLSKGGDMTATSVVNLINLGVVLRNQGRLEDAEGYLQRAVEICDALYERDHPDTLDARSHHALCLNRMERFGDAAAAIGPVISGHEEKGDWPPQDVAKMRVWRAGNLVRAGDLEPAVDVLRGALEKLTRLEERQWDVETDVSERLADALDAIGEVDEARRIRSGLPLGGGDGEASGESDGQP